jgi:hypothetical protein
MRGRSWGNGLWHASGELSGTVIRKLRIKKVALIYLTSIRFPMKYGSSKSKRFCIIRIGKIAKIDV